MTIQAVAGTSEPAETTPARGTPADPLLALTACPTLGELPSRSITAAVPVLSGDMASPWLAPARYLDAELTTVTEPGPTS